MSVSGWVCVPGVPQPLAPPPSGTLENRMLARKVSETPEAA